MGDLLSGLILFLALPIGVLIMLWSLSLAKSNLRSDQRWLTIGVLLAFVVLVFLFWSTIRPWLKEIGLFWLLTIAVVIYLFGNRFPAFRLISAVVATVALLNSGIATWTAAVIESVDTAASCKANPDQLQCKAREKEKARLEALERAEAMRRARINNPPPVPTMPPGAPTAVTTPACGLGWSKVDIPPRWTLTPGWNKVAADYEYRSVRTGQWEKTPPEDGADAIRFCAKYRAYIGDEMTLSWSRM